MRMTEFKDSAKFRLTGNLRYSDDPTGAKYDATPSLLGFTLKLWTQDDDDICAVRLLLKPVDEQYVVARWSRISAVQLSALVLALIFYWRTKDIAEWVLARLA